MKVTYSISGTMEEVLCVVKEIKAMTGMEPEAIVAADGRRFGYNAADRRKLERGDIDEDRYISDNLVETL